MVKVDDKNAGHICNKCIYCPLCLPGVVIHSKYNKSESANVIETLFNQMYD